MVRMAPEDFGPRLREEREMRGMSLDELAEVTKVSVELWEGLERNDFSRWPSGIFARAFVRDYAKAIGLDADAVVNDFCRAFPIGDRRAARIVKAQAQLIGHNHQAPEADLLPAGRERRKARRPEAPQSRRVIYAPRALAAIADILFVTGLAASAANLLDAGFLASAGVVALLYFTTSTIGTGATPGVRLLAAIRHRAPSLFANRRTVSA
jgi:transcriptional regulator with XRE-family HTH domain